MKARAGCVVLPAFSGDSRPESGSCCCVSRRPAALAQMRECDLGSLGSQPGGAGGNQLLFLTRSSSVVQFSLSSHGG